MDGRYNFITIFYCLTFKHPYPLEILEAIKFSWRFPFKIEQVKFVSIPGPVVSPSARLGFKFLSFNKTLQPTETFFIRIFYGYRNCSSYCLIIFLFWGNFQQIGWNKTRMPSLSLTSRPPPRPALGVVTGVTVKTGKVSRQCHISAQVLLNQLRNETTHIKRQSNFRQLLFKRQLNHLFSAN